MWFNVDNLIWSVMDCNKYETKQIENDLSLIINIPQIIGMLGLLTIYDSVPL